MKIMNNNSTRASSLDALRGYAILTMVLSGSVAWGVLPGWMYHAQVGPRSNFVFDGSIYGITWVDLVFPFFLFAMGTAFPFSIQKGQLPPENYIRQPFKRFPADFLRYFYSAYISVGSIFSPGCSLMAHCIGRFCLDVSHVHEDSVQNAGIRKDAD